MRPRLSKAFDVVSILMLTVGVVVLLTDDLRTRHRLNAIVASVVVNQRPLAKSTPAELASLASHASRIHVGDRLDYSVRVSPGSAPRPLMSVITSPGYVWFFDPDCSFCESQLPELQTFLAGSGARDRVYLVSVGSAASTERFRSQHALPLFSLDHSGKEIAEVPQLVRVESSGRVDAIFLSPRAAAVVN
jgi:hypothetical protein